MITQQTKDELYPYWIYKQSVDMIVIKENVPDTFTNASGYALYIVLNNALQSNQDIILSFEDIPSTSSSFLNSSIGALVEDNGISILNRIKPVKVGSTQALVLKKYITSLASIKN